MLDDLLESVRLQRRSQRALGTRALDGVSSVELTDVGYRYGDGTLALDGINLQVTAGEWIGIVGPSGAGKTTLANILVGLTQPTTGAVRVNGVPAAEFDPASWAKQFALVTQEPTLLRATVSENIAFYRSRDAARVVAAAEDAGIRDEIELLPQGFDTPVGDGNATLSGGQRQRVAIARALLDRPSCLLLDEPTSALDAANEAVIEEALLRIDRDTIVVIVSHRPRLLERCNRIISLENGRVVPTTHPDAGSASSQLSRTRYP
jgi:ABC-type bacteriocin/lantibiotic exporter with double-glycine peptidase domain